MRMLICTCMVALMAVVASAEVAKSDCGCTAKKTAKAALSNGCETVAQDKEAAKAAKKAAKKEAAAKKKAAAAAAEAAKASAK